ncbi:MAG: CRISPR-associated helicase Cas3' [Bacteroidales bacterium]
MSAVKPDIWAKSNGTSLFDHLIQTKDLILPFAEHADLDGRIALKGALIHDIGKAHPEFQKRLRSQTRSGKQKPFRHEIASILFLPLLPREEWDPLIEMIIAHHKSIQYDSGKKGILDLEDGMIGCFSYHAGNWELWSADALEILEASGLAVRPVTLQEAKEAYEYVLDFVERQSHINDVSVWRGLLMAADHTVSALADTDEYMNKTFFRKPEISFYQSRKSTLYPLSLIDSDDRFRHTLVIAPTGAGKTDFLIKRCKGRFFYTLPFQASINAMYNRIGNDLKADNPNLDIRLLHASSKVVVEKEMKNESEMILQGLPGASVKVLTPYQMASIAFGIKGYESMLLDLKDADIILDEIHTYTGFAQWLVLKITEILIHEGCRVHIGSATMPEVLQQALIDLCGENDMQIVRLPDEDLDTFDRHIIHKINEDQVEEIILEAIRAGKKVLIVRNRVKAAQESFLSLREKTDAPMLLLHSRFRRKDRAELERRLLGIDSQGNKTGEFNTSEKACIVVSTQVVEVSLDISFDVMITDAAPLDALIQRFGRINRKRSEESIASHKLCPVYILNPPDSDKDAKPYDSTVIQRSYNCLPDNEVIHERAIQSYMNTVFPEIQIPDLDLAAIFGKEKGWLMPKLTHVSKSVLLEKMEIETVACILESDEEAYKENSGQRIMYEIPLSYKAVFGLTQSYAGNRPFLIPDVAYNEELGLLQNMCKKEHYKKYDFL